MGSSTAVNGSPVLEAAIASLQNAPPKPSPPEKRRLERNLRGQTVYLRIREAERHMEAGERELGFYLRELKERGLYRDFCCSSFEQFVLLKTGLSPKKARDLVRVAKALECLPLLDHAFAAGEVYWSAVRAITAVATPQNEASWVEYAKSRRVDEVE